MASLKTGYIYTQDEYTARSSSRFSVNKNDKTIMYYIITIVPQHKTSPIKNASSKFKNLAKANKNHYLSKNKFVF